MAKKFYLYVNAKQAIRNGEKKPWCDCKATLPNRKYPITVKFTRNSGVNLKTDEGIYKVLLENSTQFIQISVTQSATNGKEYETAYIVKTLGIEKVNNENDKPVFDDSDLEDLPF